MRKQMLDFSNRKNLLYYMLIVILPVLLSGYLYSDRMRVE
ncbi:hypothetical protein J2TS4_44500 [Paenibacillus sp. J2TS4]|nr:hypothetical protein J2TS4_44500 [Paenibacillus sp. J2TS4]